MPHAPSSVRAGRPPGGSFTRSVTVVIALGHAAPRKKSFKGFVTTRGPSSNGTKSWCFPGIMSFLCVTALASWMLPTPRLVVLGGESGNRFGPRTHIARERPEVSMA